MAILLAVMKTTNQTQAEVLYPWTMPYHGTAITVTRRVSANISVVTQFRVPSRALALFTFPVLVNSHGKQWARHNAGVGDIPPTLYRAAIVSLGRALIQCGSVTIPIGSSADTITNIALQHPRIAGLDPQGDPRRYARTLYIGQPPASGGPTELPQTTFAGFAGRRMVWCKREGPGLIRPTRRRRGMARCPTRLLISAIWP